MKRLIASSLISLACLAAPAVAADVPDMAGDVPAAAVAVEPAAPALTGADGACADIAKKCSVDLPTGIKMAYVEVGPADGPVLILLHGLTDSSRSWSTAMAELHKADPKLHIYALDQRGHGASSMPAGAGCAASPKSCFLPVYFGADVIAFMNKMNIQKAAVAGHSMGSIVAQQVALDRPDRITATILVATTPKSKDNAIVRDYVLKEPVLGAWKKGLEAKGITTPEAVWNATPRDADPKAEEWILKNWDVDPVASADFIAPIASETAGVKMGTWIGATEAILDYDNTARLANLTVPTLVLWGKQDSIFYNDPDQTGMIAALKTSKAAWDWKPYGAVALPQSGAQENDIGHNVQWDAPRQVAADIVSFLATGNPLPDSFVAVPKPEGGFAITNGAEKAAIVSSN